MNGEHAGPACGLTSLLPAMSCRGRAAAFARDLQTRLRSLGSARTDDDESVWLTTPRTSPAPAPPAPAAPQREHDTYSFELECESPSSPVDEFTAPSSDWSPIDDQDPPFYDLDSSDVQELKEPARLKDKTKTNGFRYSTAFIDIAPQENGHAPADKKLYSAITFEGCARQDSRDETDCAAPCSPLEEAERLGLPVHTLTLDTDSEFESAKSDPSEVSIFPDDSSEQGKRQDAMSEDILEDATEAVENLSIADTELYIDETKSTDAVEETLVNGFAEAEQNCVVENSMEENSLVENASVTNIVSGTNECLEIIMNEAPAEKEVSPTPEVDETLLSAEPNTEDNDLDIDDDRPQRVRRCSSLKTGKTPPGTPGRKKIVRFADVLGLDLADVKTFMDEIPIIPKSAYDDLKGCCEVSSSPNQARAPPRPGSLSLAPLFQVRCDLTDRLERLNVCLESARVGDGLHISVCGSVRVRNLDFHKTVHVRYTMNRWKSYTDLQASYVSGSCDGFSDRFQFVLYVPCISSGQRLELAVRFQCKGQQFWDNNSGVNYCFDCLALGASGAPPPPSGPLHPTVDWHPSFY